MDLRLAEGASVPATEEQVKKLEQIMGDPDLRDRIDNFVSYVGSALYLPFDQQLVNANFGQFIINTKSNPDRESARARLLLKLFDESCRGPWPRESPGERPARCSSA